MLRPPLATAMRATPPMNQGSEAGGRHRVISSAMCQTEKSPKIVPVVRR